MREFRGTSFVIGGLSCAVPADNLKCLVAQATEERLQVVKLFSNMPPCLIGMEACASGRFWGADCLSWPLGQTNGGLVTQTIPQDQQKLRGPIRKRHVRPSHVPGGYDFGCAYAAGPFARQTVDDESQGTS